MVDSDVKAQRASIGTQLFYGFGSISVGIKNNLLGTFLLIYYNVALGLDAILAATALSIALVFDAVSDPLIGVWSDRTKTKWGRRHPFMYFSIIPFSLSYYFILSDPGDISQDNLFWRLVFWLIVLRMCMTLFEVPRGALAPELSKDYDQRNNLAALSMIFGWAGGAGIDSIARAFWLESFVDINGYQSLAFWGGIGIFIGAAVSCIGTHRNIPDLYQPESRSLGLEPFLIETKKEPNLILQFIKKLSSSLFSILASIIGFVSWLKANLSLFIKELKQTLSNRAWLVLFLSGCFYALLVGLESGVGTYYNEFFWQWKPGEIALYPLLAIVGVGTLVICAPFIAKGRSKKKIAVGVFIFTIIVGPLPVALRLVDLYYGTNIIPQNGSNSLWYILAIHQAAMAALGALGFVFIGSMSMDIVEQVEKSTDRREEGLLGTINAFVHKLVGAGGVLISGLIISFAGFDNPNATQAELYGGDIINNFAVIHLVIGITLPFISTLLVLFYDIDRYKHNTHVSDLGYIEED